MEIHSQLFQKKCKEEEVGGGVSTYIFEKDNCNFFFRFVTLTLEILDKMQLHP